MLHLSRRLADLTSLLRLINRPQRPQTQLQMLWLVASGEGVLLFMVEGGAKASSLNLTLFAQAEAEIMPPECWVGT